MKKDPTCGVKDFLIEFSSTCRHMKGKGALQLESALDNELSRFFNDKLGDTPTSMESKWLSTLKSSLAISITELEFE